MRIDQNHAGVMFDCQGQVFLPAGKRLPCKIRNQSWEQFATPPQARITFDHSTMETQA
jgi:hypothetical protein